MKVVEINEWCTGSTGRIMLNIALVARQNGVECVTISSCKHKTKAIPFHKFINNRLEYLLYSIENSISEQAFFFNYFPTKRIIKIIKSEKPDIVHLHNIHGGYINYSLLFSFIRKNKIKIVWTLHDAWPFTGRCPCYQLTKCQKWKTNCQKCPFPKNLYPRSVIDRSKSKWKKKKELFNSLENVVFVTPSAWMQNEFNQSYLAGHKCLIINNGIDLGIFNSDCKPTTIDSFDFKDKKIILGVASSWGKRKGLDVFIRLSNDLPTDYQIVLVGTNSDIDKMLPKNIKSIHRTNNQKELAFIYSLAYIFVNPTREDNFPTVNMESIACGTPVITFDTGGCSEIIDNKCGIVIKTDDYDGLLNAILNFHYNNVINKFECVKKSMRFDMNITYEKYVKLYKSIIGGENEKKSPKNL